MLRFSSLSRCFLRAVADPGPLLHQQFPVLAVGLEVERCDDAVADQHRQREVAELPLLLRQVGLELVVVAEEQLCALALDDQRIERRQDVRRGLRRVLRRSPRSCLRPRPVLLLAGAFERDRYQFAAADALRRSACATAALRGASRWQIESRLTRPCARERPVEQVRGGLGRRTQPSAACPSRSGATSAHRSSACRCVR